MVTCSQLHVELFCLSLQCLHCTCQSLWNKILLLDSHTLWHVMSVLPVESLVLPLCSGWGQAVLPPLLLVETSLWAVHHPTPSPSTHYTSLMLDSTPARPLLEVTTGQPQSWWKVCIFGRAWASPTLVNWTMQFSYTCIIICRTYSICLFILQFNATACHIWSINNIFTLQTTFQHKQFVHIFLMGEDGEGRRLGAIATMWTFTVRGLQVVKWLFYRMQMAAEILW